MKKLFLTSAIIAVMSCPAIALDANNHIQPSPTNDCVESTLGTATGPANLEADWTANTINLEWYNEDTKLTVPTTSNTCTYDGGITLPSTNPTKTGYTFKGWKVRSAASQVSAGPNCVAISDYVTCENTDGCFYQYWGGGCRNIMYLKDIPYGSCAEIPDETTCWSAAFWEDGSGHLEGRCEWNNGECVSANFYDAPFSSYGIMPKSWCEEVLKEEDPSDCGWYGDDDSEGQCNCED